MPKHTVKKYFDLAGNLIIKPYRLMDLTIIFDVSEKTLRRWIREYQEEIGERNGFYYSAAQVTIMLNKFGRPQLLAAA